VTQKEKNRVRRKTTYAIRVGRLVRRPCEWCGDQNVHAHHEGGYTDPLNIMWLCAPCHADRHREIRCGGRYVAARRTARGREREAALHRAINGWRVHQSAARSLGIKLHWKEWFSFLDACLAA
jgi:hypothetical protein